jgi:hypothetical protein
MTAITPSLLARLATLVFFLPALSCGAEEKEVIEPKDKITLFDGKTLDGWKIFGDQAGWTAKDGVLATTGKPTGYIRTEKHYRNYRLSVEWRWSGEPTNSGVLLHMQAPDKTLPKAVEAQLKHQNAGDLVLLSQSTIVVNGQQVGPGDYPMSPKRGDSAEKPPGQWNRYEITCDGGKVTLVVNGRLMNEGTAANPSSGAICLQSEGSPIEFRNIVLEPLAK